MYLNLNHTQCSLPREFHSRSSLTYCLFCCRYRRWAPPVARRAVHSLSSPPPPVPRFPPLHLRSWAELRRRIRTVEDRHIDLVEAGVLQGLPVYVMVHERKAVDCRVWAGAAWSVFQPWQREQRRVEQCRNRLARAFEGAERSIPADNVSCTCTRQTWKTLLLLP